VKPINVTRRIATSATGRRREEYFLLAPDWFETPLGARIPLGGRRQLKKIRTAIDRYLNSNPQKTNPHGQ
jgi:hypothetical protein